MIIQVYNALQIQHPSLDLELNSNQAKLKIKNGEIKLSMVDNLYELQYDNYIHYTPDQDEILKIIKDNI